MDHVCVNVLAGTNVIATNNANVMLQTSLIVHSQKAKISVDSSRLHNTCSPSVANPVLFTASDNSIIVDLSDKDATQRRRNKAKETHVSTFDPGGPSAKVNLEGQFGFGDHYCSYVDGVNTSVDVSKLHYGIASR